MSRALYPGTFDPIHNGHIDIATRASMLFDELVVAVYDAPPKKLLFSTEERLELAAEGLGHLPNIRITSYTGLTVTCARQQGAQVIVRGLRNVADFQFEYQIGWANRDLANDLETCCLFCDGQYSQLSATILKEVASLGGDFSRWAPAHVQQALLARFAPPSEGEPVQPIGGRKAKLDHRG